MDDLSGVPQTHLDERDLLAVIIRLLVPGAAGGGTGTDRDP